VEVEIKDDKIELSEKTKAKGKYEIIEIKFNVFG